MRFGLVWGVRASFRDYVESMSTLGGVSAEGGAGRLSSGEFVFPYVRSTGDRHEFSGVVRFRAHGGMLSLAIEDPMIDLETGVLSGRTGGQEPTTPIADVTVISRRNVGDSIRLECRTALRAGAEHLFGGRYEATTALDPVRMSVPDGAGE